VDIGEGAELDHRIERHKMVSWGGGGVYIMEKGKCLGII